MKNKGEIYGHLISFIINNKDDVLYLIKDKIYFLMEIPLDLKLII